MFKVDRTEYVNKTFRMRKELVEELSQFTVENNISMNKLVEQCCRYALDHKASQGEKDA